MMNDYLDVHSHILPSVDDGAKDMDMTMEMIAAAYEQGVRKMIATPHYYPGHKNCSGIALEAVFQKTVSMINKKYTDFTLFLGNEIYYKEEIIEGLKQKQIFTLAGTRYILVEFSVMADYRYLYEAVRKCINAGFYPILAHIERYRCLYKEEKRVAELINAGAYIQVNAENFKKGFFFPERKYCMKLLQNGMVHFLGSDCHNMEDRKPNLGSAAAYIEQKTERVIFERIMEKNPGLLLENKCI